ncbi:glutaminase liver mitochondrial-like isoform X1 [Labeo rohita]|uniref:glutaminase n=1 Tax=Labeo rohita TaxID=84645 RepID=A0A498MHM8_LABRO|nr:glutaminase liver mitochondrial-like isoform X1 [Labeo rohita]
MASIIKKTEETKAAGNIPQPVPRNTFPSQRPVNYVSPGSTGMPSFISNGGTKRTVPEQDKRHASQASQAWQHLGRPETHQGHFKKKVCVTGFVSFILKALQGRFVIPDFSTFTEETQKLFIKCKQLSSVKEKEDVGESATKWGISVCTVDGQSAIQCLFVSVNSNRQHCRCSYQNLRKDIIHLHALSFYLQEKKCFPEGVGINSTLDLLLQCLSTEVTCESGAALAATLANGGLCPLSGDQVISPQAVRSMLSMMQVAGMNDHSRIFHFKTSVPAKSSQSGVVLIVVPGVLGLMCWSPGLDCNGNSWRGVHFCEELVSTFQLHSFDIRTPFRQVLCYRQWKVESEGYQIMNVLLAAYRGDIVSLRRYLLSGADVNAVDYDGRSALHVAASEGRLDVIKFLVENAGANCTLKDRWGNTALQEALRCNQDSAIKFLKKYTNYEESL